MFDLLAAIQSADPPSLVLWGLFAFAAGMYPVGFMLGSTCSPCCNGLPCGLCEEGDLPDTITVTISDIEDDLIQGPDLIAIEVTSNFGSGAILRVTAPGGDPATARGPITAVSVVAGGSGYARIARVAPTIKANASGGTGADMDVSLLSSVFMDGRPRWRVSSVSISNGGSGYTNGQAVSFSASVGDTTLASASGVLYTNRTQPTIAATVASAAGTGASVSASLDELTDWLGLPVWSVASISITNGGSGYQVFDAVQIAVTDGEASEYGFFQARVASVSGTGAITGISLDSGGEYYKLGSAIALVVVNSQGMYYRDDPAVPPEVASATIGIAQTGPGFQLADGAILAPVIDENTSSATFGQITSVTIDKAGDGYLAWAWRQAECCADYYNGMTVVLARDPAFPCEFFHRMCGVGNLSRDTGVIRAFYKGPSQYMTVQIVSDAFGAGGAQSLICNRTFTATELAADCSTLLDPTEKPLECVSPDGAKVALVAGGTYSATYKNPGGVRSCHICCRGDSAVPAEIEMEVTGSAGSDGVYVLAASPALLMFGAATGWYSGFVGGSGFGGGITVNIFPCGSQTQTAWEDGQALGIGDCDHCWKKCFVEVLSTALGSNTEAVSTACELCQESPVCVPTGTYELTKFGQYTGTVSFSS